MSACCRVCGLELSNCFHQQPQFIWEITQAPKTQHTEIKQKYYLEAVRLGCRTQEPSDPDLREFSRMLKNVALQIRKILQ